MKRNICGPEVRTFGTSTRHRVDGRQPSTLLIFRLFMNITLKDFVIILIASAVLTIPFCLITKIQPPKNVYRVIDDRTHIGCIDGYQYLVIDGQVNTQLLDERNVGFPCK